MPSSGPPATPKLPRSRLGPLVVLAVVGLAAWAGWRWQPSPPLQTPSQRPSTFPEGARVVDEDAYDDGSYDIHFTATESAFVRWAESLGMHEVDSEVPRARQWRGPDTNGCRMGAYFIPSHGLADWGLACGPPDSPPLEPGAPLEIEVHQSRCAGVGSLDRAREAYAVHASRALLGLALPAGALFLAGTLVLLFRTL